MGALDDTGRTAAQQLHHDLRWILTALPEHDCDLPRTLATLVGDERAAHAGVSADVLGIFSAKVARKARALIEEMRPGREAREAAAVAAEAARLAAEEPVPDLGPRGRGWKQFPGGA